MMNKQEERCLAVIPKAQEAHYGLLNGLECVVC